MKTNATPLTSTPQGMRSEASADGALATVAAKIDAKATWDDLALPPAAMAQLRDLCRHAEQQRSTLGGSGAASNLSNAKGTTALFHGASGTGKTMAAEVIANTLHVDLFHIDLARLVDKYIGETEKNLDRVFTDAERAGSAVLLFDEADALFGKRSEVKDAHDRYANIEVSYLLQRMEQFGGVAILASNQPQEPHDTLTRRLAFAIHFPLPE